MARRVFFSFHYENDIFRANVVRNSWVTKPDRESAGFWDAASWESVQKQGEDAVKRWINKQMENTSVTVVLIGHDTASRYYVNYEIEQSYRLGKGMLGIYIHSIRDPRRGADFIGRNPFVDWYTERNGQKIYFNQLYNTYDWGVNNGYLYIGNWIEAAAKNAGR